MVTSSASMTCKERFSRMFEHQEADRVPIIDEPWPLVDLSALVQDTIELVVQVNGKLRGKIIIESDLNDDAVKALAQSEINVSRFIADMTVRKVIYVKGRLVNIVAN